MSVPPTVILMHPKENKRKCSVWPLRGREGLEFVKYPAAAPVDPTTYVRLDLGGPVIGPADAGHGLLVIDATWRYAARMRLDYEHIPVRSLPVLRTAYPRHSALFPEPDDGLATVEALYAACVLTGRDVDGLLDHYRWADEFLEHNREVLGS